LKGFGQDGNKRCKNAKAKGVLGGVFGKWGASGGENSEGSDCNPRYHEDDEVNSEEGRLKEKLPCRGRIRRYMHSMYETFRKRKGC